MFELKSVSKSFQNSKKNSIRVLNHLNLSIDEGEIFGLIGLSGAGKSTTLRLFNGLEKADSGAVYLGNQKISDFSSKELSRARQKIGMIFQHFHLISNKTVYQNIAMPLLIAGWKAQKIEERVVECLKWVNLSDKINSYPNELSGGQKQRVAIARAIANSPTLLLADEPTSALDPITKVEVLDCLKDINKKLRLTIIIATHEMQVVRNLCHRVALLDRGQILEVLPVENKQIFPLSDIGKKILEII